MKFMTSPKWKQKLLHAHFFFILIEITPTQDFRSAVYVGCDLIGSAVYMRWHIQFKQFNRCDIRKSDEYITRSSPSVAAFQQQPIQKSLFGTSLISSLKMDIDGLLVKQQYDDIP